MSPITSASIFVRRKQSSASWSADHRLVLVERRIHQHRHVGQVPEIFDQTIVARVGVAIDGLQAASTIDV
jgi:hypothetical protein